MGPIIAGDRNVLRDGGDVRALMQYGVNRQFASDVRRIHLAAVVAMHASTALAGAGFYVELIVRGDVC